MSYLPQIYWPSWATSKTYIRYKGVVSQTNHGLFKRNKITYYYMSPQKIGNMKGERVISRRVCQWEKDESRHEDPVEPRFWSAHSALLLCSPLFQNVLLATRLGGRRRSRGPLPEAQVEWFWSCFRASSSLIKRTIVSSSKWFLFLTRLYAQIITAANLYLFPDEALQSHGHLQHQRVLAIADDDGIDVGRPSASAQTATCTSRRINTRSRNHGIAQVVPKSTEMYATENGSMRVVSARNKINIQESTPVGFLELLASRVARRHHRSNYVLAHYMVPRVGVSNYLGASAHLGRQLQGRSLLYYSPTWQAGRTSRVDIYVHRHLAWIATSPLLLQAMHSN
jgi:hypothetical protein